MTSTYPISPTAIDMSSETFVGRQEQWRKVLDDHEKALQWCVSEGQEKYIKRHTERGMLLCITIA